MKQTELVVTVRMTDDIADKLCFYGEHDIRNFRVNFARGNFEKNLTLINMLKKTLPSCCIQIDLPGSKKRLLPLREPVSLEVGTIFILSNETVDTCMYSFKTADIEELLKNSELGDVIVFGDNSVRAKVIEKGQCTIKLEVIKSGIIKSKSGFLNISSYFGEKRMTQLEKRIIGEFDNENVIWNLSFADSLSRVKECRSYITKGKLIAKVESSSAVKNFKSYSPYCDGFMLARGDLSNFYDDLDTINYKIFTIIKKFSDENKKIFSTATSYFESLAIAGEVSEEDRKVLQYHILNNPTFLITNETSYSKYWKKIVAEFEKLKN